MAQNKKYYWLKLKEDFFEEKQIKYLRKLPDGDKLVIAYLKMQLKSLKTEGFIKYDSVLPSNIEELSMILDEDINIITLLIKALQQVNAIEILDDGSFYMIAMQDLIGKEGQSAERVRRFRQNQKQKELKMLQCNTHVTKCNTEIEKEKEIDIEKEIELDVVENKLFNKDVTRINDLMLECLNTTNINNIKECINYLDELPLELIEYALRKTARIDRPSWQYTIPILESYIQNGFTTLEQIKADELKHKSRNKEIVQEETEEEKMKRKIKELEDRYNANQ
jgi:predicted phage replisome organizer